MNPYTYIYKATKNGESLLSLCCGVGLELVGLKTQDITAVDIAPQYISELKTHHPEVKAVISDALSYCQTLP